MASPNPNPLSFPFTYPPSLSPFTVPLQPYISTHPSPHYTHIATSTLVFHNRTPTSTPRVLLLQRSASDSMPERWEVPGGACDEEDETILHAAVRELWEETGLKAKGFRSQVGEGEDFTSRSGKRIRRVVFVVDVEWEESGEEVRLDPKEHQNFVWASRREIEMGRMADGGEEELVFTTEELRQVVLASFSSRANS